MPGEFKLIEIILKLLVLQKSLVESEQVEMMYHIPDKVFCVCGGWLSRFLFKFETSLSGVGVY